MNRSLSLGAAILAAIVTVPLSADAALIMQRTVIGGAGGGPIASAILSLGLDSPSDTMLFEGISLTEANEGQTFIATSASDPHFDTFVTTITDGSFLTSNLIRVRHDPPGPGAGATGYTEPLFFFNDPTGASGIDLIGFNIDSISMRVDQFDTPGIFTGNGNLVALAYTLTFGFDGSPIPEPSRAVLLMVGVSSVLLSRRRRVQGT